MNEPMNELVNREENRNTGLEQEGRQISSDPDNYDEKKTDQGGEIKTARLEKKAAGRIAGTKRMLALILAVCMILIAAGTARLAMLGTAIDDAGINWEDWLERRPYEDSITLASHARQDLYDILSYVQLKQALEEPDGSLQLDRPVSAAVLSDNTIAVYTLRDMMELGEEMGIYVYEGMTEREPHVATALGDEDVQIRQIIWSVFDYETGKLNPDSFAFVYGEENPWDIRIQRMAYAIDAATDAIAADPDAFRFVTFPEEAGTNLGEAGGNYKTEYLPTAETKESALQEEGTTAAADAYDKSEVVSYAVVEQELISLSEYCSRFLIDYLQDYYIWKEQFSVQESSLHWQLCLVKDGRTLTYGDPAAQRGEIDREQLNVSCWYDSETKAVISTFHDAVDMMYRGSVKSYQIHEYDACTFYLGLETENLQERQDSYGEEAFNYIRCRKQVITSIIVMGVSLLAFLIAFIWLTVLSGRQDKGRAIALNGIDRLPTEIWLAGTGALICLGIMDFAMGLDAIGDVYYYNASSWYNGVFVASLAGMVVVCSLLLWLGWYGLVRRIKARTLWRNSLVRYVLLWIIGAVRRICGWVVGIIREMVDILTRTGDRWWKTLGLYGICLLGNLLLWTIAIHSYNSFIPLVLMAAGNIAVVFFLLRKMSQRKQVQNGVDRIAAGEIDYQLPLEGLSGDAYVMAVAINSISDGLKNAVEEKVKNERMRAELITNVSHDIKTPLTSIINYVDLLKRENIENPKVQEYLNILEKKAERLRVLTEDLVEASKASSGVLKLNQEEIDFVELVNQTNGEFSDRFSRCDLRLICSMPEQPVYILADGRYVWRVLENLYRNVEKYALPGTRVYVEVAKKGNRICFVMKNISASELNIRAEELTERFIRGDASRTTEGSGLGLSIARDLTRLMNGTFQIYLDGDLFRVTVSFLVHE